jgi:hypothetical protein
MLSARPISGFALALTALLGLAPACALAQQIQVPRDPLPTQNGDPTLRAFDMQHLKDVPYNGNLPKPIFPSTDRVQRAFIVEYVYDYAYSAYKPEVVLPVISPLQAKRSTPEDALIGFFSAMRSGDFEAFVKSFDATSQAALRAGVKEKNQGPAYWQNVWKNMFGGKTVTLVDRIETNGFVILDTRLASGPANPPFPTIFKLVDHNWVVTNDLEDSPVLDNLPPKLAGEIRRVQPMPLASMTFGAYDQQISAQKDFLNQHDSRDTVVHVGH